MGLRSWLLIFFVTCVSGVSAQEPLPGAAGGVALEAKPADEKPLPNLESLIARAKESADAMLELRKNYTYKEVRVGDEFDSKGNKKGTHSDESQIFYVQKTQIEQHIAHDGQPLSEGDKKKEQERVDKLVAESKAGKQKKGGGFVIRASSLLKVATVSTPRRELVNGRSTILFDYKGNPDAKANDPIEEVMKKLQGTIALDEQEAAIVHWDGALDENFHVMGGLLINIKKGSHFEFESTRVNNEVWFARSSAWHVDGRILLFKGLDGDGHTTYSDYRKMRTSVTLLPGSQVIGEDGKPVVPDEGTEVVKPKP